MAMYGWKKEYRFKIYTKYNTRAGDIFFFYRPKVRSEKVESIEDVMAQ